jgi:hypothetical protein
VASVATLVDKCSDFEKPMLHANQHVMEVLTQNPTGGGELMKRSLEVLARQAGVPEYDEILGRDNGASLRELEESSRASSPEGSLRGGRRGRRRMRESGGKSGGSVASTAVDTLAGATLAGASSVASGTQASGTTWTSSTGEVYSHLVATLSPAPSKFTAGDRSLRYFDDDSSIGSASLSSAAVRTPGGPGAPSGTTFEGVVLEDDGEVANDGMM